MSPVRIPVLMTSSHASSYLSDKVRVPDDGAHEESVVGDLLTLGDLGLAQVEVHLVVGGGDVDQVKVAQPVDLQLEGQARLQVPVDLVLAKLSTTKYKVMPSLFTLKFLYEIF